MNKHFLASANTGLGFKNHFNFINISKTGFTYILKGGPGTGKSTIMKNLGLKFESKGFDVEYFYCSSDPESLDGIFVPQKNISFVDGTAPHTTDPTIPGIKEKILNVGNFISSTIKKHRHTIESNLKKKSVCFEVAYNYLNAVYYLIKCEELDFKKHNKQLTNLKDFVSILPQKNKGNHRILFASFICSKGLKQIYHKNRYKKVIPLNGNFFKNANILHQLEKELIINNYNFISFKNILNPDLTEAIYIEQSQTLILSYNPKYNFLNNFKNKNLINKLICLSGSNIEKAKYYHKKVEKYYIKNMDFKGLAKFIKATEKELI